MEEGYVKLWRKSLKSIAFKNYKLWYFWSWCLMKATWKPYKALIGLQTVDLEPGQFIFGLKSASKETKLSISSIRRIISVLILERNIALKTTNKFSIITICNWEIYQGSNLENDNQNNKQTANKRQTNGNIQEVKELKEIKKKDIPHTSHTCSLMPVNRFHTQEYQEYKKNALDILHHLNTLYGKHFPDHYMGISVIIDRLYEGKHQEDFTRIMNTKLRDPHFQKNRNLYCPETLFSEKNFERYLHEDPDGWRLTPKPPEPEIEFTHSSDDWYKGLKKENDETAPA